MTPAPLGARGVSHRLRRSALTVAAVLVSATLALPASAADLSASARKQISAIAAFKSTLTPAEKKLSTRLLIASRIAQGKPLGPLAPFAPSKTATLQVEVNGSMSPSLLTSAAMRGAVKVDGAIPASVYSSGRIRASVTPAQLLELASNPDVTSVREPAPAHANIGSVTSQGYIAHGANTVVASGINGAGVRVGVLSDSASAAEVATLIKSGDLPSNTVVLPGQGNDAGGENEGTAMMEIIHDIAPGAQLFFATAFTGEQEFADNIRALRFQYHCDFIVDDISYFDEPVFQDGLIAKAVNDITKDGGLYFSSAANSGNLTDGTSGTWESDFKPFSGSVTPPGPVGTFNDFALTGAAQPYDVLTSVASSGVWLHWSDALGKSSNDYDLYILDPTGSYVKAVSNGTQDGTQDPLEYVYPDDSCGTATPTGYCPALGDRIVIALYNGAPRALHVDTERATVSIGTARATFGHNAAQNTFTLAATFWNSARKGITAFDGKDNPVETFSSDGPRKVFYGPDGVPYTPNRFLLSNGGKTLLKPDATAADGVTTHTPGFNPFYGTSAAAPHAAAVAALVKSAKPSLTNLQIRTILTSTALDNMSHGWDRDGGYGVLFAPAAVKAAKATK